MEDKQLTKHEQPDETIVIKTLPITKETLRSYICPKANDQELVMFGEKCKINNLNPFAGDAYLVKYGDSPAQMIVSEAALNKKIHSVESLRGIQDGIIVQDNEGKVLELEGEFYTSEQKLVGAWAIVTKDGQAPYVAKVRLDDYDKNQSLWNDKKARMINKIARVHVIRRALPEFQGFYIQEEMGVLENLNGTIPANKKDVAQPQPKSNNGQQQQKGTRTEKGNTVADSIMDMANKLAGGDPTKAADILEKHSDYNGKGLRTLVEATDGRLFHTNKSISVAFDAWEKQNA